MNNHSQLVQLSLTVGPLAIGGAISLATAEFIFLFVAIVLTITVAACLLIASTNSAKK